ANGTNKPFTAPSFQEYQDNNGNPLPSGAIRVEAGAKITSNQGQVLLFAPSVDNEGLIQTPGGQTILGSGKQIYLEVAEPTNPDLRGLLIEVGNGGTVTNGSSGQIIATEGNVTLAGLAVNQLGRVSATTTVRSNGSIRLQARDASQTSQNKTLDGIPDRS